jgi:hypothetical protein
VCGAEALTRAALHAFQQLSGPPGSDTGDIWEGRA